MLNDQSASLGYVLIVFPIFWGFSLIVLISLLIAYRKTNKQTIDWILIGLCTPIPTLLIGFLLSINPLRENTGMTYEYNKDYHRHREVRIEYSNQKPKRLEFYTSFDTISDSVAFPATDKWLKDSVWIYYDKSGKVIKTERYMNDKLIK
jgi:hypothetical protein